MNRTLDPSPLSGTLQIMPSKSASHRAVMLSSMAMGESILEPLQLSDDIRATLDCAQQLGLTRGLVLSDAGLPGFVRARIKGRSRDAEKRSMRTLDCGESGSTLRFFIPLALDGRGPVRFRGRGRLMQRPLSIYEDIFKPQGVSWELRGNDLTVEGRLQSGQYTLPGNVSSQFITGLLLSLPLLKEDSSITLATPLESQAYVEMTRQIQKLYGMESIWSQDGRTLYIPGSQIPRSPGTVHVEGDWSQAAFFLTAGVLGSGEVSLTGLDMNSLQADRAIVAILESMGARITLSKGMITASASRLMGRNVDVSQFPDLVPILAVAMAAAGGESHITGAARLRLKESDRLSAMAQALQACGCLCMEEEDGLFIRGGLRLHGAQVEGCQDHRIVMAMAVASAFSSGRITITDAEAVAKSAPTFWQDFKALGGRYEG